jgi:hypothetical protein
MVTAAPVLRDRQQTRLAQLPSLTREAVEVSQPLMPEPLDKRFLANRVISAKEDSGSGVDDREDPKAQAFKAGGLSHPGSRDSRFGLLADRGAGEGSIA